jgi:methyl-accepting chemotaxis protein
MHQMLETDDRATLEHRVAREQALYAEYRVRHEFWTTAIAEGPLKQALLTASYTPAIRFFQMFEGEFSPAVLAGDKSRSRALALGNMTRAYDEHRKAIDQVVVLATQKIQDNEAAIIVNGQGNTVKLASLGALLLSVFVFIGWFMSRLISRPIQRAVSSSKPWPPVILPSAWTSIQRTRWARWQAR